MAASNSNKTKRLLARVVSHSFVHRLTEHLTRDLAAIFMLHRFEDVELGVTGHSPEAIRAALGYLRRERYDVLPLGELFQRLTGQGLPLRKAVAFTIDDGYVDQATVGASLFAEFDCPITMFLITGFLDGVLWPWDAQVEHVFTKTKRRVLDVETNVGKVSYRWSTPRDLAAAKHDFLDRCKNVPEAEKRALVERLSMAADVKIPEKAVSPHIPMSWNQARQLERSGVSFGSHGLSHSILSRITAPQAKQEIIESWRRLNEVLNNPLPIFCYPTGRPEDFGAREIQILQELGFAGALTAGPGYADGRKANQDVEAKFRISRFAFPEEHVDFVQCSSGIERAKQLLRRDM